MALKQTDKRLYGLKLLYPRTAPYWLTFFFGLLVIACTVCPLFMPYIGTDFAGVMVKDSLVKTDGISQIGEFVNFWVNPTFARPGTTLLKQLFDASLQNNQLLVNWTEYVVIFRTAFLLLGELFALILLIMLLKILSGHHLTHKKGPFDMAVAVFIFMLLYSATAIVITIGSIVKDGFNMDYIMEFLFPYIFFLVCLVSMIFMGVIYVTGLKDTYNMVTYEDVMELKDDLRRRKAELLKNKKRKVEETKPEVKEEPKVEKEPEVKEVTKEEVKDIPIGPAVVTAMAAGAVTKKLTKKSEVLVIEGVKYVKEHQYAEQVGFKDLIIKEGVETLYAGAFANCTELRRLELPYSLKEIQGNVFFNCHNLKRISYEGTKKDFRNIQRGSNWLFRSGTTIIFCIDGPVAVDPKVTE